MLTRYRETQEKQKKNHAQQLEEYKRARQQALSVAQRKEVRTQAKQVAKQVANEQEYLVQKKQVANDQEYLAQNYQKFLSAVIELYQAKTSPLWEEDIIKPLSKYISYSVEKFSRCVSAMEKKPGTADTNLRKYNLLCYCAEVLLCKEIVFNQKTYTFNNYEPLTFALWEISNGLVGQSPRPQNGYGRKKYIVEHSNTQHENIQSQKRYIMDRPAV